MRSRDRWLRFSALLHTSQRAADIAERRLARSIFSRVAELVITTMGGLEQRQGHSQHSISPRAVRSLTLDIVVGDADHLPDSEFFVQLAQYIAYIH